MIGICHKRSSDTVTERLIVGPQVDVWPIPERRARDRHGAIGHDLAGLMKIMSLPKLAPGMSDAILLTDGGLVGRRSGSRMAVAVDRNVDGFETMSADTAVARRGQASRLLNS